MTENAVSAEAIRAMRRAGAEVSNAGVTSVPRCFEMGHVPNTDRIIEFGDVIYALFCSTSYLGYQTCYYRSFIIGRLPNDKEKDWNKRCYERVHSVIDAGTVDIDLALLPGFSYQGVPVRNRRRGRGRFILGRRDGRTARGRGGATGSEKEHREQK